MNCPQCGYVLRENETRCWNCGAYMPQAVQPVQQYTSQQSYQYQPVPPFQQQSYPQQQVPASPWYYPQPPTQPQYQPQQQMPGSVQQPYQMHSPGQVSSLDIESIESIVMFKDLEAMQEFAKLRQAIADEVHTQIGTFTYYSGLEVFVVNNIAKSGRNDLCHYAFAELFGVALHDPLFSDSAGEFAMKAFYYAIQHVDEDEWPSLIALAEEYLRLMKNAGVRPPKDFYKLLTVIFNKRFMVYIHESRSDTIIAPNAEKVYRYACLGASSLEDFKGTMAYGGIMMATVELKTIKGEQYFNTLQQQIKNEGGTILQC